MAKRFVAVKLIKAGMDSKQVLARFEAERQALALMDHPNIAKVLDGGLTLAECAESLGISPRTADTWWAYGRAWLATELQEIED